MFQLTLHPHIIGHRSRMTILEELLEYILDYKNVWWATHAQIARYFRDHAPAASTD